MRARERARCIFLQDISASIQEAVIGRERYGGEHSLERVLNVEGLENGPLLPQGCSPGWGYYSSLTGRC